MKRATEPEESGRATAAPRLSIVVCSYNGARSLGVSLASLAAQDLAADDYEIVVVDNASTDTTRAIVDEFALQHANVRCVPEPVPGKSRALNTGIRASRATHIAFTDDDVLVSPDWAGRILESPGVACAPCPG
jgi:glycosyltransferase involved in cell wall biosynthesis